MTHITQLIIYEKVIEKHRNPLSSPFVPSAGTIGGIFCFKMFYQFIKVLSQNTHLNHLKHLLCNRKIIH